MYRIIISEYPEGAVVEKDGQLYYSLGPRRLQYTRERDLRVVRGGKSEIESLVLDGFIRHEPPTEVENLEDWPEAARKYEEAHRPQKTQKQHRVGVQ